MAWVWPSHVSSPGTWLADLCADEGRPFVRGQALSMKALHGGQAKHDTIDSHQLAALLRGGMLPRAYVYPAAMRAPRDLLRRRTHLRRNRAERLAPVQHTHSQDNLPASGKKIAHTANRDGVAERVAEAAVHKTIAVDRALITDDDARLQDLERSLLQTATHHEANPLALLQTGPGMGPILSLVRRYEIPRIDRFPRLQEFASYARLGNWRKASGGTRVGTAGQTIGNAHRQGAFAEAATLCLRSNPQGQTLLARLENKHDHGKARSLLAHPPGRAVSCRLTRQGAFDRAMFLQSAGSRAGEPGAARDSGGMRLAGACAQPAPAASVNAKPRLGRCSLSPRD